MNFSHVNKAGTRSFLPIWQTYNKRFPPTALSVGELVLLPASSFRWLTGIGVLKK